MAMLIMQALSGMRQDEAVARQGVMNHQSTCHLMDLYFVQGSNEVSIPEGYAMQGLSHSALPAQAAGLNLAAQTPKS